MTTKRRFTKRMTVDGVRMTYTEIEQVYGVSHTTVWNITKRRRTNQLDSVDLLPENRLDRCGVIPKRGRPRKKMRMIMGDEGHLLRQIQGPTEYERQLWG